MEGIRGRAHRVHVGLAGARLQLDQRAALEVDAEVQADRQEQRDRQERHGGREREAHAPEAHEAEPGVVGPEAKETHGLIDSNQNGSAFGRA